MSLVLQSSGGGSVTIQEPTTASNFTQTLPSASGTVMVSGNMPAFSSYASANQTVTDAVLTKITFDTEEFDTASCFASSRFTPNVAGYYHIFTNIIHRQTNITETVLIIQKNGASFKRSSEWYDILSSQDNFSLSGNCLVYLNGSTDYVEVYIFSDGTGNATEIGGSDNTYFQGYLARTA